MSYKFKLPICDWSGDGHSQCDWYIVSCNKPLDKVFDAYFASTEKFPKEMHPTEFCYEYGDTLISKETLDVIKLQGYDGFSVLGEADDFNPGDHYMDGEALAAYTLWFINQGDEELKAEFIDEEFPQFINWNVPEKYKKQNKSLDQIGYGLFDD